ncbi:MAG: internalization-related competence protein ComEC/Rec2 protein [Candidatus Woesebacteria bacterium GW2011_GWA1_33_30]|uniref:Internalization-related competence protein ComEC/Rec2 protein n=1 Tax=Candidatus Woesebacteria bacterium GW2011_GWA2_33_28 TaxID=1618561 RepID=A0A0G0A6I5_9BACT|nr:MAG: internalization-related competence protein ComEC/Rec2 protein [Candidatus Woesebacteria bacterium GW2011_GWA2_33_28]KKP47821.1 MAG: internalization-related competence protein ComEC/Rec2 protein [Candidatus Woesebacteria bacterium GW2011_GWA1_33_30]KKP49266.1 MAG: Metallo beta-lactamase superfamily lipoprotein [Microgenomates group bacterium GW2011_GWC1_33_32]KKP51633.1 MAG: internalization-related competence protein ComEC/Rec2 protein [Candidatus Woesebacteria bacterium GW2011_GWB1_33_38
MVYKNIRFIFLTVALTVWLAVFTVDDSLHIIACDVGQGDAILIQKNNTQILIDGGPNQKILDCLGSYMPFYDRKIELVILTHPELDHYGGLIDVVKTYNIKTYAHNGTTSSNQTFKVLENEIGGRGIPSMPIGKDMVIRLGMIYLDIVHPDTKDFGVGVNDQGIVTLLKYGQFKALFTADVEQEVSNQISESSQIQNINYLKVNHHGSKNGLSQKLLDAVFSGSLPAGRRVAVISVGAKNSYGHPHEEVIKILSEKDIKILRTDQMGDIDFEVKN